MKFTTKELSKKTWPDFERLFSQGRWGIANVPFEDCSNRRRTRTSTGQTYRLFPRLGGAGIETDFIQWLDE
ncbi:MAG: hypothetical protein ACRD1T_05030 [Acidimicrobiia bacterium]